MSAVFGALCKGTKHSTLAPPFPVGRLAQSSIPEPSKASTVSIDSSVHCACFNFSLSLSVCVCVCVCVCVVKSQSIGMSERSRTVLVVGHSPVRRLGELVRKDDRDTESQNHRCP